MDRSSRCHGSGSISLLLLVHISSVYGCFQPSPLPKLRGGATTARGHASVYALGEKLCKSSLFPASVVGLHQEKHFIQFLRSSSAADGKCADGTGETAPMEEGREAWQTVLRMVGNMKNRLRIQTFDETKACRCSIKCCRGYLHKKTIKISCLLGNFLQFLRIPDMFMI